MKIRKYFLSYLSALFLSIFTQSVSAHMLFTYETAEMTWTGEKSSLQDGTPLYLDLMASDTFQFEISFIIPDIDFDAMNELEVIDRRINNVATNVRSSGVFESNIIEHSTFWFLAYKYEGYIYTEWNLMVDIANNNLPNGTTARALIMSGNYADSAGVIVDNLHYSRLGYEEVIDIEAGFYGEYHGEYPNEVPGFPRFSMTYVSVPEPLSPMLLLLGLTGIFVARKISKS